MRKGMGIAVLAAWLLALAPGCSTRTETATLAADSTLVYPGKMPGDVTASITFADKDKVSKRTGKRLGVSDAFDIARDDRVYALVDLQNPKARGSGRRLNLHLVWLDPDDDTIFKKMLDVPPADTLPTISSSLSVAPGKREPGTYKFRVYLFRELIAERAFTLRGEATAPAQLKDEAGEM